MREPASTSSAQNRRAKPIVCRTRAARLSRESASKATPADPAGPGPPAGPSNSTAGLLQLYSFSRPVSFIMRTSLPRLGRRRRGIPPARGPGASVPQIRRDPRRSATTRTRAGDGPQCRRGRRQCDSGAAGWRQPVESRRPIISPRLR